MDKRKELDFVEIVHLYHFLQGVCSPVKLSAEKAFLVLKYLSDTMSLIPDTVVECSRCDKIGNSDCDGLYLPPHDNGDVKYYCEDCLPFLDEKLFNEDPF